MSDNTKRKFWVWISRGTAQEIIAFSAEAATQDFARINRVQYGVRIFAADAEFVRSASVGITPT